MSGRGRQKLAHPRMESSVENSSVTAIQAVPPGCSTSPTDDMCCLSVYLLLVPFFYLLPVSKLTHSRLILWTIWNGHYSSCSTHVGHLTMWFATFSYCLTCRSLGTPVTGHPSHGISTPGHLPSPGRACVARQSTCPRPLGCLPWGSSCKTRKQRTNHT